ncbi:MAG: ABC transporter permease [Oscillospiraceae bacterium]
MSNTKKLFGRNAREFGLLAIIVVLAVLANLRSTGNFLTLKNLGDMFSETSMLLIAAMGMMMVIITGGIDLSVGSTMALAGMVSTTILRNNPEMNPLLVVLIAMGVGFLAGLVNGFLVSYLNILPIIATLGTMNVYRGVTYLVSGGSWNLQQNMSPGFLSIATGRFLGISYMLWIAVVVILVVFYFMSFTRKGRQIFAVGNSIESARISGIPVRRVLLIPYSVLGMLAGLAGVLYVCKYAAAQGETALGYEMNVIASCVLGGVSVVGGVGKVQGVVMGAILLGMLNNALPLMQISPFWQEALRGVIILASILVNALVARRADRKALERRAVA